MSFASAWISMQLGHRIRRKHWSGYWELENGEVMIHCYDDRVLNLRESENMMYTLSACACDDWEIADDYGAEKELEVRA